MPGHNRLNEVLSRGVVGHCTYVYAAALTSVKMPLKRCVACQLDPQEDPVPPECSPFLALFLGVRKWYFLAGHSFSWLFLV